MLDDISKSKLNKKGLEFYNTGIEYKNICECKNLSNISKDIFTRYLKDKYTEEEISILFLVASDEKSFIDRILENKKFLKEDIDNEDIQKKYREKIESIYKIINNALYFSDKSEYKNALNEIANEIVGEDNLLGKKYIE